MLQPKIDNYEFYFTPDNPAIRQARKEINAVCIPRVEWEDREQELIDEGIIETAKTYKLMVNNKRAEREYVGCQKCGSRGIKTKYLKSTMKSIKRKIKRNGRIIINLQYLCPACAKTYKSHSERVGGQTF